MGSNLNKYDAEIFAHGDYRNSKLRSPLQRTLPCQFEKIRTATPALSKSPQKHRFLRILTHPRRERIWTLYSSIQRDSNETTAEPTSNEHGNPPVAAVEPEMPRVITRTWASLEAACSTLLELLSRRNCGQRLFPRLQLHPVALATRPSLISGHPISTNIKHPHWILKYSKVVRSMQIIANHCKSLIYAPPQVNFKLKLFTMFHWFILVSYRATAAQVLKMPLPPHHRDLQLLPAHWRTQNLTVAECRIKLNKHQNKP